MGRKRGIDRGSGRGVVSNSRREGTTQSAARQHISVPASTVLLPTLIVSAPTGYPVWLIAAHRRIRSMTR
ncbi:hypothetical protein AB0C34_01660 [Nocardia sp. NPDC049220]|uniref:hypothetical protein n=1 Tax=Nocardia sp. NPDC049220 TaxID=3155273 RepID=UPI003407D993